MLLAARMNPWGRTGSNSRARSPRLDAPSWRDFCWNWTCLQRLALPNKWWEKPVRNGSFCFTPLLPTGRLFLTPKRTISALKLVPFGPDLLRSQEAVQKVWPLTYSGRRWEEVDAGLLGARTTFSACSPRDKKTEPSCDDSVFLNGQD